MATKKSTFTKAQLTELKSIISAEVSSILKEELANSKKTLSPVGVSKKSNSSKKQIPAFAKLEVKKNGRSYIVVPTGKLGKAYRFYAEDAKTCGGEYVAYNADTEKGGWWKFSTKEKADKFFDLRKADYEKWAKAHA